MYIVPQRTPAPSAAQTPRKECAAGPCADDARASSVAPTHMISAPPSTPVQRRQPASRNSLKKTNPHNMPRRLLEFQSGNAMLRPISRMAKMVMVFATAHRHPASTAQMIRWGARRTSTRTEDVPKINAGKLQRARKTPTTMTSEMTKGETPTETSFVGASAAPSQPPAVKPQRIPNACNFREREVSSTGKELWEANADCNLPPIRCLVNKS